MHQAHSGASPAIVSQLKMNLVLCFEFLGAWLFALFISLFVCLVLLCDLYFLKREQKHKVQWVGGEEHLGGIGRERMAKIYWM